jgi:hypothetical protein
VWYSPWVSSVAEETSWEAVSELSEEGVSDTAEELLSVWEDVELVVPQPATVNTSTTAKIKLRTFFMVYYFLSLPRSAANYCVVIPEYCF